MGKPVTINPGPKSKSRSVDDMLKIVGEFGPYQWILDGIFFLMVTATSPYPVMMYFAGATSAWRCAANSTTCLFNGTRSGNDITRCDMARTDWVYTEKKGYSTVTEYDVSCGRNWINYMTSSVFFIGWSFGAVMLGNIADNHGRKTVLVPSFLTALIVSLVSPYLANVFAFVVCRTVIGFLLPGVWVPTFVLISEVVGKRHRVRAGQFIKFGHTTGYCMLGVIAIWVRDWKLLHVYCTAPFLLLAFSFKFIPESMRWARLKQKPRIVTENLKAMARWNRRDLPEDIIELPPTTQEETAGGKSHIMDIFSSRTLFVLSVVQGYSWFALALAYYGLLLAAKNIGGDMYLNFILLCLADLPALAAGIVFLGCFGRKVTVISAMMVGGCCSVAVGFIPTLGVWRLVRIIVSMIGKCGVNMSLNCMYTWSSELYPTSLRSLGLGFLQFTAHFGAAIAPWIAQGLRVVSEWCPFVVMGVLVISAALASLLLSETRDTSMSHQRDEEEGPVSDEKKMGITNEVKIQDE